MCVTSVCKKFSLCIIHQGDFQPDDNKAIMREQPDPSFICVLHRWYRITAPHKGPIYICNKGAPDSLVWNNLILRRRMHGEKTVARNSVSRQTHVIGVSELGK